MGKFSRFCSRCMCRTMTREFVFTVIPFAVLLIIFVYMHDWAEVNSLETRRTVSLHNVAPVRDAVISYLEQHEMVAENLRAVIENGQWKNPRDYSDLHRHLWPLFQAGTNTLADVLVDLDLDMVHGNIHRTQVHFPGSGFTETAYHNSDLGVEGEESFQNTTDTPLCPSDAKLIPVPERAILPSLFPWFDTNLWSAPKEMTWVTLGKLYDGHQDVSAVHFAVNYSSWKFDRTSGQSRILSNSVYPVSRFFVCYNRSAITDELNKASDLPTVDIFIFNTKTLQYLAFNHGDAQGIRHTASKEDFYNAGYMVNTEPIQSMIPELQDNAVLTAADYNFTSSFFPIGMNLSTAAEKNYVQVTYQLTKKVEISRLFGMDDLPTDDVGGHPLRDTVTKDKQWRLVTISRHSEKWNNHNVTLGKMQRFFELQKDLVESVTSLVSSRLVSDIQDQEGMAQLLIPLLNPHKNVLAVVQEPSAVWMVGNEDGTTTREARPDRASTKYVIYRGNNTNLTSSRTYSLPKKYSRVQEFDYNGQKARAYFSPDRTVTDRVNSGENPAFRNFVSLPYSTSDSTLMWVPPTALRGSSDKPSLYTADLFNGRFTLTLSATWPKDLTCDQARAFDRSYALQKTSLKLSWPIMPVHSFINSLTQFDDTEGWAVLVTGSGLIIATNHYTVFRRDLVPTWSDTKSQERVGEFTINKIKEFSDITPGVLRSYTAELGVPCVKEPPETSATACGFNRVGDIYSHRDDPYVVTTVAKEDGEADSKGIKSRIYFSLVDSERDWYLVMKYESQSFTVTTRRESQSFVGFLIVMILFFLCAAALSLYTIDRVTRMKTYLKNPYAAAGFKPTAWNTELYDMQWAVSRLTQTICLYKPFVPGGAEFQPVTDEDGNLMLRPDSGAEVTGGLLGTKFESTTRADQGRDEQVGFSKNRGNEYNSSNNNGNGNGMSRNEDGDEEMTAPPPPQGTRSQGPKRIGQTVEAISLQNSLTRGVMEKDQQCFLLTVTLRNAEALAYEHGLDILAPVQDALTTAFFLEVRAAYGEIVEIDLEKLTAFWIIRKSPELARTVYQRVLMAAASVGRYFEEDIRPNQLESSGLGDSCGINILVSSGSANFGAVGGSVHDQRSAVMCGDVMQVKIPRLQLQAERMLQALPQPGPPILTLVDQSVCNFPSKKAVPNIILFPLMGPDIKVVAQSSTHENPVPANRVHTPPFHGFGTLLNTGHSRTFLASLVQFEKSFAKGSSIPPVQAIDHLDQLFQAEGERVSKQLTLKQQYRNRTDMADAVPPIEAEDDDNACVSRWVVEWYRRAAQAGRMEGVLSEGALPMAPQ